MIVTAILQFTPLGKEPIPESESSDINISACINIPSTNTDSDNDISNTDITTDEESELTSTDVSPNHVADSTD